MLSPAAPARGSTRTPTRRARLFVGASLLAIAVSAGCAPTPPPAATVPANWAGALIRSESDIAYGSGAAQKLDIYPHASDSSARGTLVYLHGGGWYSGDKADQLPSLIRYEVTRGYDLVVINYRLAPEAPFPAAVIDASNAVRWVREHGADHGLLTDKVVIAGWSAGANIAGLLAFGANHDFPGGPLEHVDGALLFSGAYEIQTLQQDWLVDGLRGWIRSLPAVLQASPARWLDSTDPPAFAVHGEDDVVIPADQLRGLMATAAQVGYSSKLQSVIVPRSQSGGHCSQHAAWCGAPVASVDQFLDGLAHVRLIEH